MINRIVHRSMRNKFEFEFNEIEFILFVCIVVLLFRACLEYVYLEVAAKCFSLFFFFPFCKTNMLFIQLVSLQLFSKKTKRTT